MQRTPKPGKRQHQGHSKTQTLSPPPGVAPSRYLWPLLPSHPLISYIWVSPLPKLHLALNCHPDTTLQQSFHSSAYCGLKLSLVLLRFPRVGRWSAHLTFSAQPDQLISELPLEEVHTPVPISYDWGGIRWPGVYVRRVMDGGRFYKVWVRQVSSSVPNTVILLNRD